MWGCLDNQDVGLEAATIEECVIAHWSGDPGRKCTGAKHITETVDEPL